MLLKLGADKVVLTEEQDLSLAVGNFTHTKGCRGGGRWLWRTSA